jgi:predicted Kef-type K+ transport protein
VHSVGVGIVLGALYFFTMIFHFELKGLISNRAFIFNLSLLQVAVFSYAAAFFMDTAAKQSFQKFCLLGVVFTLERIVTLTDEANSPVEILSLFDRFQH